MVSMILDKIAEATKIRVDNLKRVCSFEDMKKKAEHCAITKDFAFEKALKTDKISFICEVKKASPSKGIISEKFPYVRIAEEYEEAGAAAISVLTEPTFFLGCDRYLTEIAEYVRLPILRKDFTIDSYQIYEAKKLGASAVLLICELLSEKQLKEYIEIADSLGLSALVESHTGEELKKAVRAGARIIGVNNRDLKTFEVDVTASTRLRSLAPDNVIFVSESGVKTPEDIQKLRDSRVNAVLIGEALMKSADKKHMLKFLRGDAD